MSRVLRVAAGVVAGVFAFAASPAFAQDKKPVQADAVKKLEAELARLKAAEADLQAQLKKLGVETERKLVIEITDLEDKLGKLEIEKALKLKEAQSRLAQAEVEKALKLKDEQVKRAQIEFEKALALKAGQDKPRATLLLLGGKSAVPYEKMTPQELKEVIVKLQMLLEQKIRNADKEKPGSGEKPKPGGEKVKPGTGDKPKPGGEKTKPGTVSQDEILKRLDQLSKEVDELRRAIKK